MKLNVLKEQYNFNSDYFVQNNLDWRVKCANLLNYSNYYNIARIFA